MTSFKVNKLCEKMKAINEKKLKIETDALHVQVCEIQHALNV